MPIHNMYLIISEMIGQTDINTERDDSDQVSLMWKVTMTFITTRPDLSTQRAQCAGYP